SKGTLSSFHLIFDTTFCAANRTRWNYCEWPGTTTRKTIAPAIFKLTRWRRRRLTAAWIWGEIALVMSVGAAQERHSIEHVLLEPLEPQINDRCNEESDHLGKNKTADDDKAKGPTR